MRWLSSSFIRFLLGIALFFLLVTLLEALSRPEGIELSGEWKLIHPDGNEEHVEVPFYRIVDNQGIYTAVKTFPRYKGDAIMLSCVSNHGMRIYLNGTLLKEIGDFESGTANIWNYSHLVRLDEGLLKDTNTLTLEMKVAYDVGIQRAPLIVKYAKVSWRNGILNFFISDIYLLAMGGGIILGAVLLVFGLSVPGDHVHFVYIATASLLSSVFLLEFVYRETTGNMDSLLLFEKATLAAGLVAIAFLVLGVSKFVGAKRKFSILIFASNLSGVVFFFLIPNLITLKKMQIVYDLLFVVSAITLAIMVFKYRKKYLIFSATFFSAAILYSVIAELTGIQGIYISGYGVLIASLGFGVALIENYRDIYKKVELIHKKSLIDPLTGVFNRGILQEIPDFNDDVVVMIDLDNFKEINDKYGHEAGDKALVTFVEKARENLRKKDIIVRYGGDEFLLILKNCDEFEALDIVNRITSALENISRLKYSYGIARIENDLYDAIRLADERMYKMKKENQSSSLK
ncbi:hypothetical protein AT15_04660 [Kosmotoga arenicorallina S304]|uniref:GGDEF domain-containing protein n=1 Tax=Kosmotoga arenicorallina S304 TaxID=1453497 RepID=A0A176JXB2_9BACT|nr:GGDEF domain-containing protein [Kosmotoga arenicorallina]OAA28370.1 hypothetical protein AT15_04660 [Kosmotoga arenicorallina S304]